MPAQATLAKWLQNNWITSTKKPVANQDLWKTLVAVRATFNSIKFTWIKGHASCHYNNICDAMAQKLVGSVTTQPVTPEDSIYEN